MTQKERDELVENYANLPIAKSKRDWLEKNGYKENAFGIPGRFLKSENFGDCYVNKEININPLFNDFCVNISDDKLLNAYITAKEIIKFIDKTKEEVNADYKQMLKECE